MPRIISFVIALAMSITVQSAFAGIALNSTRVIIENGKKEASFGVRNMGDDILIQSWLDEEVDTGTVKHFTLTPQLIRVKANGEQIVRLMYEGVGAPTDKESMFWLNVQEIPQRHMGDSSIQIAVLQRIKVFYRPPGLPGNLPSAIRNIEWTYANGKVRIYNPSTYHVTLVALASNGKLLENALVIAPGQTYTIAGASARNAGSTSSITYSAVTDFGGHDPYRVTLKGDQPAKGRSTEYEH
ncbi:molecular chaperone [Pusillimonas sp. SM2304]|uniref:fimbrial biogenesis chaperone n=1 Tax=Pusillimonas sp. SM2304 TaxID=3073241 RepID=UPI0028754F22|nr:molecular chaperone [Pusillimonas sp. SM2304]MDS1138896.1 molecular chaperone [Pusillimonas sp. SM2304]